MLKLCRTCLGRTERNAMSLFGGRKKFDVFPTLLGPCDHDVHNNAHLVTSTFPYNSYTVTLTFHITSTL